MNNGEKTHTNHNKKKLSKHETLKLYEKINPHSSKLNNSEIKKTSVGLVVSTGFYTFKGGLIRDLLFQPSTQFKFKRDSLKFLAGVFILSMCTFVWTIFYLNWYSGFGLKMIKVVIASLDLFTAAISPTLPLCLLVGIDFSVRRLKKRGIFTALNED